ncbi:nuclear valosin-containing protein-like [Anopheles albimanus]|uniref:nuclear valosin-containing protein-like n=1 Tax=Anopheles albimanus TaxID=7167 RepID=UPI0016408F33|nr:nuclear valosin-containing protein-like [Anopheles albimanus]
MLQRKSQPISYDPMIIPRVKQYLEEHVHQTFVDVGVMARDLQQRYREYTRRKAVPFRLLVEQAYRTVLHSYGLDSNPSTDGEEEGLSDVEVMDESANRNQMSNTLTSMYMGKSDNRTPATSTMPSCSQSGDGGEAIDISSDEEDDQPHQHQQQQHGGPSASSADARGADVDKADFIATHVASNKHVTVTKVVRANKVRDDDNSNESIASSNGKEAPESKRRRVDNGTSITAQLLTQIRNNPHLLGGVQHKPSSGGKKAANSGNNQTGDRGKAKKYRKEVASRVVSTTFDDVGGMDRVLKHLCELLLHVKHPEIYRHIGLPPPRGFLLHGPPGSGKTLLAQAIAGQLKIELIEVPATELVASLSGESEERIREVFEQAASMAPCVLFIDEIDAISSNRINAQKDMERRIVSQLLNSLDTLGKLEGGDGVIVIGATNRPDAIDPALRRIGRFDQEISLGIPDREARRQILEIICRKLKIAEDIDYGELAKLTPGYVGADLLALATRAANTAIKRLFTQQEEKMLQESIDDVVAIDDEPVEVVNIDDEKDDIPPATAPDDEETVPPAEVGGEGSANNEAAGVSLTDQPEKATQETGQTESIAEPAVSTSSEVDPTVPTAEVIEKENQSATNDEIAPMEVDQPANQPSTDADAASSAAVVAHAVEADNAGTLNGPTVDALLPIITNGAATEKENDEEQPQHDHQVDEAEKERLAKKTPAVPPVVSPKELTLDMMLDLLLNQQNALSATELEGLHIQRDDFIESLKTVQPSAKREGFITVPDVTWNDIGSLGDIREELKLAILAPVKYPQRLKLLGLTSPSGVLLCGPPGCGKTLLAKAVANEAGINFISVKGPELLNMYVGESERAVRQCFQRARNSAPCVIFFDEFDALCPKRSDTASNSAGTRVVNQLLTEMDGIEERRGVFLMAATNRPDIVDPAVLRPGRLDKILYVGLPAHTDRVDILRALTKNRTQPPLADDVEFEQVADLTEGYTGADLAGLVRQASLQTLKDSIVEAGAQEDADDAVQVVGADIETLLRVRMEHFLEAIRNIKPSVNAEDKKHYEKLRLKYGTVAALC